MKFLTWLGGGLSFIDITPDPDTMAMLEQPAACDKHLELLDMVAIEAAQRKIVACGGTVKGAGAYYTPEPLATAIESGAFITTIAEHVAALKERRQ